MISATCLEYVTGVVMEMMFKMRYWDYSNKKFNIQGYICLKSSLFWGVLSVVMVCFVHVPIAAVVLSISPSILKVCVLLIVAAAAVDTANAFKKAFDFQKLMSYETRIKQELSDITDRLAEAKEAFTDRNTEKQIEFFNKQEERAERLRLELDAAKEKAGRFKNSVLKSFPTATSAHFGDVLEEFKGYWNTKK
jgi:uncharacterized membrane protein